MESEEGWEGYCSGRTRVDGSGEEKVEGEERTVRDGRERVLMRFCRGGSVYW